MIRNSLEIEYYQPESFSKLLSSGLDKYSIAPIFSDMCRANTLSMIKEAGSGHIGSSFSAMDAVTWIHLNEMDNNDVYFSSKGHDAPGHYSVLSALGKIPFQKIRCLRRLGGLPGHPHVGTGGAVTNTGSLGMGISKAKGFAFANQLDKKINKIFVMLGDGELQEGQIWESLSSTANQRFSSIIAFVDHNKLQSDTWTSEVNDFGDIEQKFEAFGWDCQRIDGHNFKQLERAIGSAKNERKKPTLIILDTIKGKGISFMEANKINFGSLYPYHSGAPSDEKYKDGLKELKFKVSNSLQAHGITLPNHTRFPKMETKPLPPTERLQPVYTNRLIEFMKQNKEAVVLDADLRLDTGLVEIQKQFPDRFFECGIAEQDMVSMAGALALKGKVPIVNSFSCFLSSRPNEQIYNNATEGTKIVYLGALAGLVPGGPGHSHQSVRDISALSAIPNLFLVEASDGDQFGKLLDWAFRQNKSSTYFRMCSIPFKALDLNVKAEIRVGQGRLVAKGDDLTIVAYGPIMLRETLEACNMLKDMGINASLIDMPWLNYFDDNWLVKNIIQNRPLLVVDNHYEIGGLGSNLLTQLIQTSPQHVTKFAITGLKEIPVCGTNDEVLQHHRLNSAQIKDTAVKLLS